ncbi:DUF5994 family protein [[Kitasatospora] papulosa]|uniref:DUF5994 family protein n=1 Tax=[Kitasatospora] papulosa TaxID=1464011 RepID=UPI00381E2F7B
MRQLLSAEAPAGRDPLRGQAPAGGLLRRQTARCLEGVLVGASWPRSRDVATELSDLIEVLTSPPGPITRVGLDTHAREGPHHPWRQGPLRPEAGVAVLGLQRGGGQGREPAQEAAPVVVARVQGDGQDGGLVAAVQQRGVDPHSVGQRHLDRTRGEEAPTGRRTVDRHGITVLQSVPGEGDRIPLPVVLEHDPHIAAPHPGDRVGEGRPHPVGRLLRGGRGRTCARRSGCPVTFLGVGPVPREGRLAVSQDRPGGAGGADGEMEAGAPARDGAAALLPAGETVAQHVGHSAGGVREAEEIRSPAYPGGDGARLLARCGPGRHRPSRPSPGDRSQAVRLRYPHGTSEAPSPVGSPSESCAPARPPGVR